MAVYTGRSVAAWELWKLPPSDRAAVARAVRRGEPVPDPRLAPSALAWAESVVASVRRQQAPLERSVPFALAALTLVMALWETNTGRAWQAVSFWAATVVFLGIGSTRSRALGRLHEKATAAADYAADQIGRSPAG